MTKIMRNKPCYANRLENVGGQLITIFFSFSVYTLETPTGLQKYKREYATVLFLDIRFSISRIVYSNNNNIQFYIELLLTCLREKEKSTLSASLIRSIKSCVKFLHFHSEFVVWNKLYKFLNMNFLVSGCCISILDYCLLINRMVIFQSLSGEYVVEFTVQYQFGHSLTLWIQGRLRYQHDCCQCRLFGFFIYLLISKN